MIRKPFILTALPALVLAGCATTQTRTVYAPAEPIKQIYVYPAAGQPAQRMDRDRYECHLSAAKQSGFDPSRVRSGYQQRYEIVSAPPPGTNTVGGALAGAVLGAAVAGPGDAGGGALVGAAAGAVVGAAADSANQQRVARETRDVRRRDAALEQRADDYRRAISACLEGRGYTVR